MTAEEKKELLNGLFNGATIYGKQYFFFGDQNTMNINESSPSENTQEDLPTAEQMAKVVESTISKGLWWGNTAWSVIFRIMQMRGYKGSVSQFVRDVSKWPFSGEVRFICSDDAVSRPLRDGKMLKSLESWPSEGVQGRACLLGEAVCKELECMT